MERLEKNCQGHERGQWNLSGNVISLFQIAANVPD